MEFRSLLTGLTLNRVTFMGDKVVFVDGIRKVMKECRNKCVKGGIALDNISEIEVFLRIMEKL